jgi:Rieske 2Fe-2S family protein
MNSTTQRVPILPASAYTSREWFEREQRELFSKVWQFAGFIEDLEAPGDYVTTQCGLTNILVVKGNDFRLRAMHNLCRHRGTQLLRSVGRSQKAISCPYHDWTYDLDGKLLSVPDEARQFPQLDKAAHCLHPASVETWRGLVFVHPSPNPPESLMAFLGEAEPHLMPHEPELLEEYEEARATHTIRANWKLVAENYIDGYHLARLHSGTLNMYDHAAQETRFAGRHYLFFEPPTPEYAKVLPQAAEGPLIDHISHARAGAYVPLVFPNLGLAGTESTFSTFFIEPVAVDETRVHLRSKVMPSSSWDRLVQATHSIMGPGLDIRPKDDAFPPEHPLGSADFMAEDVYVCEQQQRSFASPMFSGNASALEHEAGVRGLQTLIQDWMEASAR